MFKCKYCGKEFEKKQQLAGHVIWCKENPNRSGKSNFNNSSKKFNGTRPQDVLRDDLFCQYCGKQCKNVNSLRQHEVRCKENPNGRKTRNGFKEYNERIKRGEINRWNKGLNVSTSESVAKQSKALIEYYKTHDSPTKGTTASFESNLKRRIAAIDYIESTKGECKPRYNKNSISYINKLNEKMSWNLQHAENGGEIRIDGYFLDGYDKELNIAFEYNERGHYKDPFNNILNKRDIERNNYIKNKLKCKFYIYNEFTDSLYEF